MRRQRGESGTVAQTALNESAVQAFVQRWAASGGAERANYQLFLTELCDVLDVPHPEPTQPDHAAKDGIVEAKSRETSQ